MRPTAPIALASLLLGCASTPDPHSDAITSVTPAPEWNVVFERTEGWIGGDGAATVSIGNDALWLFGDSGIGRVENGKYAPGSTLVNNAVALHTRGHAPPTEAVRFAWGATSPEGKPSALFVPPRPGEWYWPTGGGATFSKDGPRLVLFMSRLFRPREHDDGVWNFEGRGSDLLWIENPGPDPRSWTPQIVPTPGAARPDLAAPARRITWGTAIWVREARRAAELYIFGVDTTDPLNKKALLARTDAATARQTDRWEFWKGGVGSPWSGRLEGAAPVAEHVMDEFSVTPLYHERTSSTRFYMVYSEELLGRRILARAAAYVDGPWSQPVTLYTCPEPTTDPRLIVYSAKAHPELSREGELLVSYCVNSTDFWHMLSDASIYRPRFIRVPLSLLPEPPAR